MYVVLRTRAASVRHLPEVNDMQRNDVYDLHSTQLEIVLVSIEKRLSKLSDIGFDTYSLESFYNIVRDAQIHAVERETGA
jgi:hypothetical protein